MSFRRVVNMFAFMARLYRLPLNRLPAPDAIVVSSPSLFPVLPAKVWSRKFGARLVFEVRDVWPLTLQELGGLSTLHPLIAVISWFKSGPIGWRTPSSQCCPRRRLILHHAV